DAGGGKLFVRQVSGRIELRRRDERVGGAQARRRREKLERIDEAPRAGLVGIEIEAQHAAEILHLSLCELVARVIRQTRIVHPLNLGPRLEIARDRERVLDMPSESVEPKLAVVATSSSASMKRHAPASSESRSKHSTPPKSSICRFASSWPG